MNTEVISKAAYSNGLQENGQDGVVFTMPASRKKFMSVYIGLILTPWFSAGNL